MTVPSSKRFVFIADRTINISSVDSFSKQLKIYRSGRWEVNYGASANTIGDIQTGALFLIIFAVPQTAAGVIVQVRDINCRIRYTD